MAWVDLAELGDNFNVEAFHGLGGELEHDTGLILEQKAQEEAAKLASFGIRVSGHAMGFETRAGRPEISRVEHVAPDVSRIALQ